MKKSTSSNTLTNSNQGKQLGIGVSNNFPPKNIYAIGSNLPVTAATNFGSTSFQGNQKGSIKSGQEWLVALYTYSALYNDELSFKMNDRFLLIDK